jgi:hypothetical protein
MECLICFDNILEDGKYKICKICKMCSHIKCYKLWESKSGSRRICILCQQKNCLVNINNTVTCLDWLKRCVYNEDYVLMEDK